ncbi:hypothetical protein O6H91_08G118800 [Diphasiastrum complanatum]|uniref:Uncharacterized protein n=1 Tax=Diphasiastrum complanatum TaxID=34168 RepID=A0ACC2D1X2_DIPCM|nr:hypothetical protein O6H91_08G118800 [Diphasiastrum complanatum]
MRGTNFCVVDKCQGRTNSPDVLAYEGAHKPSLLRLSSLEEVGLSMLGGDAMPSALGHTMTLNFGSKFLLSGHLMERYQLDLSRRLAEFAVELQGEKRWLKKFKRKEEMSSSLISGDQVFSLRFVVNHGFSMKLYKGARLFWRLKQLGPSPLPDIIDLA